MIDLETKRLETQAMLDNAELLFDQDQCRAALQKVADEITRDLGDKYPLLLPVMGGAVAQWHIAVLEKLANYQPYNGDYYIVNDQLMK